jgi:hypothetical protein
MPDQHTERILRTPGLGACRLRRRLLVGDAGELWEAAVPDVPTEDDSRRTTLALIRREAAWASWRVRLEQVARLEHLGWATPQGVGRNPDDDDVFAVYDLSASTPLDEWARGEHPLRERIGVIAKLAASLTHAHARGVHHEHLSPCCIAMNGACPTIIDTPVGQRAHADDPWALPDAPGSRAAETPAAVDIARLGAGLFWILTGRPIGDLESDGQDPVVLLRVQGVADELITIVCKSTGIGATPRYLQVSQFELDIVRVLARGGVAARGRVRTSMSVLTAAAVTLTGIGALAGYIVGNSGRAASLAASNERANVLQETLVAREAEMAAMRESHNRQFRAVDSIKESMRYSRYNPVVSANRLATWSMLEMLYWPVDGPGQSFENRVNFHETRVATFRRFVDHSYQVSNENHLDTMVAEVSLAAWEMQMGRPSMTVQILERVLPRLEPRLEPSDSLIRGANQLLDFAQAALRGEVPEEAPGTEPWVIHIAGNQIANLEVGEGNTQYRELEPLQTTLAMRQTDPETEERDRKFTEEVIARYRASKASAPSP